MGVQKYLIPHPQYSTPGTEMSQTTKPVELVHSRPVRFRSEQNARRDDHRKWQRNVRSDGVLDKTIHAYRLWWRFLKLALELEAQNTTLIVKEKSEGARRITKKIMVKKRSYAGWDLDEVLHQESFDAWWGTHRHLFIDEISEVLATGEPATTDESFLTLKLSRTRRLVDVINDLKRRNKESRIFEKASAERFPINGRVRPDVIQNRYNALVLKIEDKLTNRQILMPSKRYIRPTQERTKDGYQSQRDIAKKIAKVITKPEDEAISGHKLNLARTINGLITGSTKEWGAKQMLLSVCDGYFPRHPIKTYWE